MAGSAERLPILGCTVDQVGPEDVAAWIRHALADPWDGVCRHLVTLNPEYVMRARQSTAFALALRRADLSTADGVGIVLAARWLHRASLERMTGVQLVELLAVESGPSHAPVFLLGAAPGVAEAAAQSLRSRQPGSVIPGWWSDGSAEPEQDRESIERIAASGARVVAVAYGAPGQVTWILRNQDELARIGIRLAIGVGGALDYLSGQTPLPPALVRRAGLEWLYRLVREPWRWRRQLVLPHFAALVVFEAIKRRLGSR